MSVQLLVQQQSPLKNESHEVQKAMLAFAYGLCREYHIKPDGLEHVTHFGFASDSNNCEAISNWVFYKACHVETDNQKAFKALLSTHFERELIMQ